LKCELTVTEGGKWAASFSGENKGAGPNRPYRFAGELVGKEEGSSLNLTGDIDTQRQGVYAVSAVMTDESLKATFKKKTGGGDGSFDLTVVKAEAAATPEEPKAQEQNPK
jgi:hypothetical protein